MDGGLSDEGGRGGRGVISEAEETYLGTTVSKTRLKTI